jgi:biopolymer transport protein ExbD
VAIKIDSSKEEGIIADINVTPLIDIMLVLLIIFMVTSSISLETGLDINIPQTNSNTKESDSNVVLVSLHKNGKIFIQGNEVLFSDIRDRLKEKIKDINTTTVVFEGDESSTLGETIRIMDEVKASGAKKFAVATKSSN